MGIDRRAFLQFAGAGAGLGVAGAGWAFHDSDLPTIQPSYGDLAGLKILGYNDMSFPPGTGRTGNWDQTYEFRVLDVGKKRLAYCGNGGNGWSIVDVTDPKNMFVIHRHPHSTTPDNTQYIDVTRDGSVLVVKRNRRLEFWNVTVPTAPALLGQFAPADIHPTANAPFHGLWVHEDRRGRFAFAALFPAGFTDQILICVDFTDASNPVEVSRWWYPGMKAGETPSHPWTWPGARVQCHDMTTYGDHVYAAWRDKGLIILDMTDITNLTFVGEVSWADPVTPEGTTRAVLPGETHSFGIIVPKHGGPVQTIVATDELGTCPFGYPHILDVRDKTNPTEISTIKLPLNLAGNCPPDRPGRRMGIHDVDRLIRGDLLWSAWEEGGFWAFDISDIHRPKPVAYFVPPVRSDSANRSGHADDVFVMDDGIVFGSSSDRGAGGLWAMRYVPGQKGKVAWNTGESDVIVSKP